MRAAPRPAQAGGIVCVTAAVRTADNRKSKRLSSFEGFLLSALPGHDILASAKETGAGERARRLGGRQVLIGPSPRPYVKKNPEYVKYSPDFFYLSGRKISRSKLLRTQKDRFLCRARRKAQEYWLCIPSIFNEVRRENILFALQYPYSARPRAAVPIFYGKPRMPGIHNFLARREDPGIKPPKRRLLRSSGSAAAHAGEKEYAPCVRPKRRAHEGRGEGERSHLDLSVAV